MTGSAESCLGMAYALESDPAKEKETVGFYHRACLLGVANACTNYAATIWTNKHSDAELTCARRASRKHVPRRNRSPAAWSAAY